MTDTQMDLIRASAVAIVEQIQSDQDFYQVNEFLAGLLFRPPYTVRILRIPGAPLSDLPEPFRRYQ